MSERDMRPAVEQYLSEHGWTRIDSAGESAALHWWGRPERTPQLGGLAVGIAVAPLPYDSPAYTNVTARIAELERCGVAVLRFAIERCRPRLAS